MLIRLAYFIRILVSELCNTCGILVDENIVTRGLQESNPVFSLSIVVCVCVRSHIQLFVILWTVTHQAPLSMGILQARVLEWVAMPFLQGIFPTLGLNPGSRIAGRFFTVWTTREIHEYWRGKPIPSPGALPAPAKDCITKEKLLPGSPTL